MSSQYNSSIDKSMTKLKISLSRRAFIKISQYPMSKYLYQVSHPYFKGMSKFSELIRLIESSGFVITKPIADSGYIIIFKPRGLLNY